MYLPAEFAVEALQTDGETLQAFRQEIYLPTAFDVETLLEQEIVELPGGELQGMLAFTPEDIQAFQPGVFRGKHEEIETATWLQDSPYLPQRSREIVDMFQDPTGDHRAKLFILEGEAWGIFPDHELKLVVNGNAVGGRWGSDIVRYYLHSPVLQEPGEVTESTSPIEYLVGWAMIIIEMSRDQVGRADVVIGRHPAIEMIETVVTTLSPPFPQLNESFQFKSNVRGLGLHIFGVMWSSWRGSVLELESPDSYAG